MNGKWRPGLREQLKFFVVDVQDDLMSCEARFCRGIGAKEKDGSGVCAACKTLLDLKESFVHSGRSLKQRRAIHWKPANGVYYHSYYDLKKQNEFLVKSVFDGNGNFL